MVEAIAYRGLDGAGVWSDSERVSALSHRRLAILDLTPTGAQPMVSADGRWVISYNGEVYNAEAIAASPALAGLTRRGTSDTEVILESLARRGLDRTLVDLNCMCVALWDRATETLHLVRDRLGIKPLFYAQKKRFYFLELKSFAAAAHIRYRSRIGWQLTLAYVPASFAIYRDVHKVLLVRWFQSTGRAKRRRKYWDLGALAAAGSQSIYGFDADARKQA